MVIDEINMVVDEVNLRMVKNEMDPVKDMYNTQTNAIYGIRSTEEYLFLEASHATIRGLVNNCRDRYTFMVLKALLYNPYTDPAELFALLEVDVNILGHRFILEMPEVFPLKEGKSRLSWCKDEATKFAWRNNISMATIQAIVKRGGAVDKNQKYYIFKPKEKEFSETPPWVKESINDI